MKTFVFVIGKHYIVVSSNSLFNAEAVAQKTANGWLGAFNSWDTIWELPLNGVVGITAAIPGNAIVQVH